jgi:hypothetical protein
MAGFAAITDYFCCRCRLQLRESWHPRLPGLHWNLGGQKAVSAIVAGLAATADYFRLFLCPAFSSHPLWMALPPAFGSDPLWMALPPPFGSDQLLLALPPSRIFSGSPSAFPPSRKICSCWNVRGLDQCLGGSCADRLQSTAKAERSLTALTWRITCRVIHRGRLIKWLMPRAGSPWPGWRLDAYAHACLMAHVKVK